MLALQGCCNNLPSCGTALWSVQDKHTQMLIFYNLFLYAPGNLAKDKFACILLRRYWICESSGKWSNFRRLWCPKTNYFTIHSNCSCIQKVWGKSQNYRISLPIRNSHRHLTNRFISLNLALMSMGVTFYCCTRG